MPKATPRNKKAKASAPTKKSRAQSSSAKRGSNKKQVASRTASKAKTASRTKTGSKAKKKSPKAILPKAATSKRAAPQKSAAKTQARGANKPNRGVNAGSTGQRAALGRGLSALMGGPGREVPIRPPRAQSSAEAFGQKRFEEDFPRQTSLRGTLQQESSEREPEEEKARFEGREQRREAVSEAPAASFESSFEPPPLAESSGDIQYVPIRLLQPNPGQPRKKFRQTEIDELSNSISESGVLQPILVRRVGGGESFEIVAGERRFRAAKQAKFQKIPAVLRELSDQEALEIGIIENVQRSDLDPIEEALAYGRLQAEFGETQESIAEKVGKDRASIANGLRLLRLPEEIKTSISAGKLSAGHGRALLMLEEEASQVALARQIIREGLSVRAAEAFAARGKPRSSKKGAGPRDQKTPAVLELENRIRQALGTKVSLAVDSAGKGELRINFFSKAEFQNILDKFGV